MSVRRLLFEPEEVILVDDVVTRGATIIGGVNRLKEAFPSAEIRAFAMMRLMSSFGDFVGVKDPCVATITMYGNDTRRKP